jgi:hypothetical protein
MKDDMGLLIVIYETIADHMDLNKKKKPNFCWWGMGIWPSVSLRSGLLQASLQALQAEGH